MRQLTLFVTMLCLSMAMLGANPLPARAYLRECVAPVIASPDTSLVCFTQAEAESIARAFDQDQLKIRLLEADLAEARPEPEPTGGWFHRTLRHPALWFCLGAGTVIVIGGH